MKRGSIVLPICLIAVGVILLLNNLGHLPWTVWATIGRLWPILLIALGLDILFGRSALRWVLGLVVLILVAIAVVLFPAGYQLDPPEILPPRAEPVPIGPAEAVWMPIGDATRAEMTLAAPVGAVVVRASLDRDTLLQGTVSAVWPDRATWSAKRSNGTEQLGLTLERSHGLPPPWWPERSRATVELGTSIPLDLRAILGEGRASLDLSGLDLASLTVQGGPGEVDVTLPARGRFTAHVASGRGEITVRVPAGLGARIRVEEGWGAVDAPRGWRREARIIVSPHYDVAEHWVDLTLRASPGRIRILTFGAL